MKKIEKNILPYGIADYEKIKEEKRLYVDKTEYIKCIEENADYLVLLRPRRFGKSLFVSTLENYYDINKKDKFDILFGDTYIGQNSTELKNSYYILKFNFSGVNTDTGETIQNSFLNKVLVVLQGFLEKYNIDIELPDIKNSADLLIYFFGKIRYKLSKKIYVLIDEYDQFANELLGFNMDAFLDIVSENGFVRKFYEALKEGTENGIVGRMFITGVSPITLDSMTSGFNITESLTQDLECNDVMGFTKDELLGLMKIVLDEKTFNEKADFMLEEMKFYYDGYKFNEEADNRIYNSDMCLYYLKNHQKYNKAPKIMVDTNIASDYSKLTNLFALKTEADRARNYGILEEIIAEKDQYTTITDQFNFKKDFEKEDFISLLFYLGFLTIDGCDDLGYIVMKVPNQAIKDLYFKYFMNILKNEYHIDLDINKRRNIFNEMANGGKIDSLMNHVQNILESMSNRDCIDRDEGTIKGLILATSYEFSKIYLIKSEYEVANGGYIDIAYLPTSKQTAKFYHIIELKYIKQGEFDKKGQSIIDEKENEACEQIKRYEQAPEINELDKQGKLKKWVVIFVKDKCVLKKNV